MVPPGGGVVEGGDSDYCFMVGGIPCGESAPRSKDFFDLIPSEVLVTAHRSQGDHESANSSNLVQSNNTEDLESALHEGNRDESANASNLVQRNNTEDLESALLVEASSARSKVSLGDIHDVVEVQLFCRNCKGGYLGLLPVDERQVTLRQLAVNFRKNGTGRQVEKALMDWAWKNYYGKFKEFKEGATFSAVAAKAVKDDKKHLLNALREVARTFIPMGRIEGLSWSVEIGEQYFTLCVRIVHWNRDNFHPNLKSKMDAIKVLAVEGAYKFEGVDVGEGEPDGVDVGKFVIEVLLKNQ